jgi:hypothetical protein
MEKILLLLFASIVVTKNVDAQKTHADSTEVINAAHRDAMHFMLSNSDLEKFHKEHFPVTSDYFKPTRGVPKVLLADSLFVKTYKLVAFDNVLDQRTVSFMSHPLPPGHISPGFGHGNYPDPVKDIAQKDAQRFNLSTTLLAKFKSEHFSATSDYFKPAATDASDPAMLKDSVYVHAFRAAAYNRAKDQRAPK